MIFGWDISTSIIGFAVFDENGKYVSSDHLDLRKLDGMIAKADATAEWIRAIAACSEPGGNHIHYVEDRLSGFGGGPMMQKAIISLAGFNAVVSYIIWNEFRKRKLIMTMQHIHPSTVKAIMKREGLLIVKGGDKKTLTLNFVSMKEKTFAVDKNRNDKPQPWCFDRADAYIVARAGFLRNYLSIHAARQKNTSAPIVVGA